MDSGSKTFWQENDSKSFEMKARAKMMSKKKVFTTHLKYLRREIPNSLTKQGN